MSSIPFDHDCFRYLFRSGSTGTFWFDYVDGMFGYWYTYIDLPLKKEWQKWDISLADFEYRYPEFIKTGLRNDFCGPMQPPPPPHSRKIREMEKRRQVAYA